MQKKTVMLTQSSTPLEFDTLGAVKIRHFFGDINEIYCYARFYIINGGIAVGVRVFERADIATTSVRLKLCSDERACELTIELDNKSGAQADVDGGEDKKITLSGVSYLSGDDNQGFYWGAEFIIDKKMLDSVGIIAKPGKTFLLNMTTAEPGKNGEGRAFIEEYGNFIIVPY